MRLLSIDSSRRSDDEGAQAAGPQRPSPLVWAQDAATDGLRYGERHADPDAVADPGWRVVVKPEHHRVLGGGLVHADGVGGGRRMFVNLAWDAVDPLAVGLQVEPRPDHPALPRGSWVVLRDFLRYGLTAPTGDGEVRIQPDDADPVVWIVLARKARPCRLAVPIELVTTFLDRTEDMVPCGEERADLDAVIQRLLLS